MANVLGVQPQLHQHAAPLPHRRQSSPSPTPAPVPRNAESALHLRLSPEEFQEGLRRSADAIVERGRNVGGKRSLNHRSPQEEIVGPFLASSSADVERTKKEVQAHARQGPEAVRRWATQNSHHALERSGETGEWSGRREVGIDGRLIGAPSKRQWIGEQSHDDALDRRQTAQQEKCYVGNDVLSCYPTAGMQIPQDTWSRFIWNHNYPRFAQIGFVDVYLFRQDTDTLQTSWMSQPNEAGRLSFSPTELYWANRQRAADIQPGQNLTWPFYFVVTYAGQGLTGTTSRLATWTAVQTALPLSIQSSQSSAAAASAAAAASSSAASASASAAANSQNAGAISSSVAASLSSALQSSLNADGMTGTQTLQGTATVTLANGSTVLVTATGYANGSLPLDNAKSGGSSLPGYAIALIVIFGLLALIAFIVGWYFLMAWIRRRRHGSSSGSTAPMMVAADGATRSSYIASDAGLTTRTGAGAAVGTSLRSNEDEHPFTSDEATRMADAFRAALRKPEFAGAFGAPTSDDNSPNESDKQRGESLLREELASEGKGLQAVGGRRQAELHIDSD